MSLFNPKKWAFPGRSIHTKLLGFFLVVALIPVLSLGLFSFNKSSSVINSQFGAYASYAVTQLKSQVDSYLSRMEYFADDVVAYLSNSVTPIPDREPNNFREYKEQSNLTRYLSNYSPKEWGVLITNNGMVYGDETLRYDQIIQEDWWKRYQHFYKGRIWVGFHPAPYYSEQNSVKTVISLLAPVGESFNVPEGSMILVEIDAAPILELFYSFEKDTHSYLKITDENGELVYITNADFEPQSDDLIWTEQMATNGWVIEARMPKETFYESPNVIRNYMIVTALASLIIALLCAELFSSSITKRIRKLSRSMNQAGLGDFTVRTAVDSEDELSSLNRNFNQMLQQIQSLIKDISRVEKQKKEVEISLLHYQINPHVLLNTLNTIQWKARLTGQKEIERMLFHLFAVLEESHNFKQEIVPLRRELEVLNHFLAIQRFRFGDVFQYTESIDPALMDCKIPRMTLQPLFENIFFHALEDGKGLIHLNADLNKDGDIVIEITDNGKGMSEEEIKRLFEHKPEGVRGGYGLYNADQKIKIHFGQKYGVSMESKQGAGTKIIILLPREGGAA